MWQACSTAIRHRRDAVQLAAGGVNLAVSIASLRECFEENTQTDAVPLLKDYAMYEATLPARERGVRKRLKLYQPPSFYATQSSLGTFSRDMTVDEQQPTVAYIAASSHSKVGVCVGGHS